ncbi:methyl-accepting chemotaxis protein [Pseudorhodoplanes sp.]|uniref:methyl-accepting chemotaxis protein n=1 Tax=Pseudorhodoplanes sp. TaxID=1934341 RepID=UPI003D095D29
MALALCGYAALFFVYYATTQAHRDSLRANSTYIEFERHIRDAAANQQIALTASLSDRAVDSGLAKAAAIRFVDLARSAAQTNTVPAFQEHFQSILSGVTMIEDSLSGPEINLDRLRDGLRSAQQALDLLVLIAGEGRKAEWDNLMEGSHSSLLILLALIGACAFVVAAMGYLIAAHIRRTFSNVIRINSCIADGVTEVDIPRGHDRTEAGHMYATLQLFRENATARHRLEAAARDEAAARARRQQYIEAQIARFRDRAREMLTAVASNMFEMRTTAQTLTRTAEETPGRANAAAAAADDSSCNVQATASAVGQLAASISGIAAQVIDASAAVNDATQSARTTDALVDTFVDAARTIGKIVETIRGIAEQTNLLALNATIEAARSGDMGKGFAVVASEVKSLAHQTAGATNDIASQISAIQQASEASAEAIKTLAQSVERAHLFAMSIRDEIETQRAATSVISHNVQRVASQTQMVATNMSGVTVSVDATLQSAAMMERASTAVVAETEALRETINNFLEDVASA